MQIIYWTHKHFNTDNYKDTPKYNKHSVMILAPNDCGMCFNLSITEEYAFAIFDSYEEAEHFVLQQNKPVYSKEFGTRYTLQFLENDSQEWYDLFDKWDMTYQILEGVKKYYSLPKYQLNCIVYWEKTKSFLKKLFVS